MRVAALYDIHGNLPALEAVLGDVRRHGADRLVVGGDVLPGPMSREAIECLLALDIPVEFVLGNCETDVLAYLAGGNLERLPAQTRAAMRWSAEQLRAEDRRLIASWPQTLRIPLEGIGDVVFCHATPRHNNEIFTRLTPEDRLLPIFAQANAALVVCGHTHMQFDRMIGATRVINAGSVGMPFGQPGAFWAVLGPDVQLRRSDYALSTAADRIRATAYPGASDFAERYVLQPPSEREMLALFETVQIAEGERQT